MNTRKKNEEGFRPKGGEGVTEVSGSFRKAPCLSLRGNGRNVEVPAAVVCWLLIRHIKQHSSCSP